MVISSHVLQTYRPMTSWLNLVLCTSNGAGVLSGKSFGMVITYTSCRRAQRGPSFEACGSTVEFFGQLDEGRTLTQETRARQEESRQASRWQRIQRGILGGAAGPRSRRDRRGARRGRSGGRGGRGSRRRPRRRRLLSGAP